MISCCSCQKEFKADYNGGGEGCDSDVNVVGVINCGYGSKYDCDKLIFLNKHKPIIVDDWYSFERIYNPISLEQIENFYKLTPSRGQTGEYKYVICDECIDYYMKKGILTPNNNRQKYPFCALCGTKVNIEFFYFKDTLVRFKDCEIYDDNIHFNAPVVKGIKLIDDYMSICNSCYFFNK